MITPYSNIISVTTEKFPFEFTVKTDNAGVSTSTQFKLPLVSSLPLNAVVDWGDVSSDTITVFNQAETTHTYASSGTYTVSITGDLSGWQFADGGDKLKMLNVSSWGSLTISVGQGFQGCANLTCSATDAPLITSTSLLRYFQDCTNFNGAIGNWDMSNVTSMNRMFRTTSSFNQPIGNWSVQNVTDMLEMFEGATAFNQDIGSWNVSNVSNFRDFMSGKTAANYSAANLDSIYNGWSSRPVQPNISIKFGTIKYNASSQASKDILTSAPNNWTIVDGGQV
jgi:surface protein